MIVLFLSTSPMQFNPDGIVSRCHTRGTKESIGGLFSMRFRSFTFTTQVSVQQPMLTAITPHSWWSSATHAQGGLHQFNGLMVIRCQTGGHGCKAALVLGMLELSVIITAWLLTPKTAAVGFQPGNPKLSAIQVVDCLLYTSPSPRD